MEAEAGTLKRLLPARLRSRLRLPLPARLLAVLAIIGPGIITANVDNDAGGIATYSLAGAQFGYGLLWTLIPITVALIVVQEICARMGAITGKGLADLIREQYGVKVTFYIMVSLLFANLANTIAEFAGVAAALEIFGVSKYISIPIAAFFVWWLVVYGTYRRVEIVFLIACVFYIAYPISGFLAQPPWGQVARRLVVPEFRWGSEYLMMLVGMVGTTIAPWMQFYLQSAVVEKGVRPADYRYTRYDVIVGCLVTDIVAMFIIVACAATLHEHHIVIQDAKDAAWALAPLAGKYCSGLFAFGLFNASLFAASILPLSTAYYVCEGFGWETGIDKKFREAPQFFGLYSALIVLGAALILIPRFPLLTVMYLSQVLNGVLLPFVLIFMLLLVNRPDLMGAHVNSRSFNVIAWGTSGIMIVLTIVMVGSLLVGG
jgi:Mn2+/Fe2+ NRAMP family transporter